jgi:hypothetical protein
LSPKANGSPTSSLVNTIGRNEVKEGTEDTGEFSNLAVEENGETYT